MRMSELPADFVQQLHTLLGADLHRDSASLQAQAGDNSWREQRPALVACPRNLEQVQAVVRLCHAWRVQLVARGAGTGTTGAAVPTPGSVALVMTRMDRILAINPADRCAVVQPGVLNGSLQQALRPHGLFWAPDPSSFESCSIGGNLATNAGGPRAVRYGTSRDNVLGLKAVDGRGELIVCGGPWTKDATGYDLTHLLVGSEGTLAVIVEATLKLHPLPAARAGLRAFYRDAEAAAAAVARIMAQPVVPTVCEFLDARSLQLLRGNGATVPEAGAMLLLDVEGDEDSLPTLLGTVGSACEGEGLLEMDVATDGVARERLWAARRALSPALKTIAPGKINEDVVVPVSQMPALVAGVQALSARFALPIVTFGHAGNGNLHVNILYHPDDAGQNTRAQAALPEVFALVLALGGTLSGEHGIGLAKRDFMPAAFNPATLALMRAIKHAFDPAGILNPGKLLPPG